MIMKNIFSFNLYKQGLRKVRGVGIAMAIVIIALNAIVPILCMIEDRLSTSVTSVTSVIGRSVDPVEIPYFAPFGIAVLVFAPILIYAMFSFLNERRSADFYHAIPHKRACVFVSFLSAALTWLIGVLLVSAALNSILWAISPWDQMNFAAVGLSFAAYAIIALTMAGFMALAMMLTGTTISNCLVFLLVLFFVRTIGFFFLYCLEDIAPMFVTDTSWLKVFEMQFFMPFDILAEGIFGMDEEVFYKGGMMIYWLIVSILLLAASGVLYVRRRSEWATKSAPNKILQHIYRIAVTLPFMLLGIIFVVMEGCFEAYHLIFFVIALIVYALYELLTTKKIKNLVRSLPLVLVPMALCLVFVGIVYGAKGLIYASIPTEEKIEGVALMHKKSYSTSYENAVTYGVFVDDEALIRDTAAALAESKEWKSGAFYNGAVVYYDETNGYIDPIIYYTPAIVVKLDSGREVAYYLRTTYDISTQILSSAECREAYLSLPGDEEIRDIYISSYGDIATDDVTTMLWKSFKEEYEALSDADKYLYKAQTRSTWQYYFEMNVYGTANGRDFYTAYSVNDRYTPKTAQLYRDLCNAEYDPVLAFTKLRELLMDEEREYLGGNLELQSVSGRKSFMLYQDSDLLKALELIAIDEHLTDFGASDTFVYRVRLSYSFVDDAVPESDKYYYKEDWTSAEFFIAFTLEEEKAIYELANHVS